MNLRKYSPLTAFIAVLVMAVPVYASLAPLSPAFLKWKKDNYSKKFSASSVRELSSGYIPSPVNLSHLRNNPPVIETAAEIPESYDLRKLGRVTTIRDQNPWGTCWAFGTMSSIESNYLTRSLKGELDGSLGNADTLDLSELHLAWYSKNDPDKSKTILLNKQASLTNSLSLINGGGAPVALASLTRLDGPVLESSLPYLSPEVISRDIGFSNIEWSILDFLGELPSYNLIQILSRLRLGKSLLPSTDSPASSYDVKLRVTDALHAAPAPMIGMKYRSEIKDDSKYVSSDYAKLLIMEYGALTIGYYSSGGKSEYLNPETHAYYYPQGDEPSTNHQVAIVGWDDNFSRMNFAASSRPDYDGAWLVRNNWADFEGSDGGYFWLSYEQYIDDGIVIAVQDMPKNIKIYDYSPLGWCDAFGDEGSKSLMAANTFKVKSDGESLESISFYTTDNNALCEWEIYYDLGTQRPSSAPYTSSDVKVTGSKTFPYAGYHTVKLSSPIALTKGHYFSVVIKFTNPEHDFPAAVEMTIDNYSDFAVVHDGETWFSSDGSLWIDGTAIIAHNTEEEDENLYQHITMNACIKAFTIDSNPNDSELPDDTPTVLGKSVKDFVNAFSTENFNSRIVPDEPLEELVILLTTSEMGMAAQGDPVTFYLADRSEERQQSLLIPTSDSEYQTGKIEDFEFQFDPLFESGYEPDEFWKTFQGIECPVFGPFESIVSVDSMLIFDVNDLKYSGSGRKGSVPKGYYDLVYTLSGDTPGFASVRLSATARDQKQDNTTSNNDNSSENSTVSSGGSSGGCTSGVNTTGLLLIALMIKSFHPKFSHRR